MCLTATNHLFRSRCPATPPLLLHRILNHTVRRSTQYAFYNHCPCRGVCGFHLQISKNIPLDTAHCTVAQVIDAMTHKHLTNKKHLLFRGCSQPHQQLQCLHGTSDTPMFVFAKFKSQCNFELNLNILRCNFLLKIENAKPFVGS